jgi:hypothetical protein
MITSLNTGTGSGASSGPATAIKPSTTKAGDLLVVGLVFEKGAAPAITPPSGWTFIQRTNETNNVGIATFYKIAGEAEPSSYVFGLTQSPKWSIGIINIEGADPNNPIGDFDGSFGKSFEATVPSVTTDICNSLVLNYFANKKDVTWTPPAGSTEMYDVPNTQQGLTSNMLAIFVQSDKGDTGTKTALATINDAWVAQSIVIRTAVNNGSEAGRIANNVTTSQVSPGEVEYIQEVQTDIQAYPNPVRDVVNITINNVTTQPASSDIVIVDRIGRMHPARSTWSSEDNRLMIDLGGMSEGMYMIHVRTSAGNKSVRVLKQTD